jgi:hypothetical protein
VRKLRSFPIFYAFPFEKQAIRRRDDRTISNRKNKIRRIKITEIRTNIKEIETRKKE